jgi:hypothetical protein
MYSSLPRPPHGARSCRKMLAVMGKREIQVQIPEVSTVASITVSKRQTCAQMTRFRWLSNSIVASFLLMNHTAFA